MPILGRSGLTKLAAGAGAALLLAAVPAPASAHEEDGPYGGASFLFQLDTAGTATGGMEHVANVQYPADTRPQTGTDLEFIRVDDIPYVVAGTTSNGMQIVDVSDPTVPVLVATLDCPINQGDVQIIDRADGPFATYTADSNIGTRGEASTCGQDLGLPSNWQGTVLVDLSDPANPVAVSAVQISTGSHNMTVHPGGNFLYNSNSELVIDTTPTIEIVDITDVRNPVRMPDFSYPFNPSSLGANSHDVAFRADGLRGYSASLSNTLIMDTSDPGSPTLITSIENPRINVEHDVKHVPLTDSTGVEREFLFVGDEIAGAIGNGACPGGGITIFEITGDLELAPVDLGTWFINDLTGVDDTIRGEGEGEAGTARCTAHVFAVYPEQGLLTIAWYERGVRVLDISGLADYAGTPAAALPVPTVLGDGIGITEIGSYVFTDQDTWSFKTNRIEADGSFYGYGNDLSRGLDVYYFPGFADDRTVPTFGDPVPTAVVPEFPVPAPAVLGGVALLAFVAFQRRRTGATTRVTPVA